MSNWKEYIFDRSPHHSMLKMLLLNTPYNTQEMKLTFSAHFKTVFQQNRMIFHPDHNEEDHVFILKEVGVEWMQYSNC